MEPLERIDTHRRPPESSPPHPIREGRGDEGEGGDGPDYEQSQPIMSNARLGMLFFLAGEGMLFAGFIGAFLVYRLGNPSWPPPMQPRLPVGVTGMNTAILLASGVMMFLALKALRRSNVAGLRKGLTLAAVLGAVFLAVQGYEWARLINFGFTMSSGIFGSTFYTLIGLHGIHVISAVVWLLVIFILTLKHGFLPKHQVQVEVCGMYWYFVVGLWPILYVLVYLN